MSHRVTIHKHTFPTIKEAASHFGMPRETLSRKVNGGMSAEDAVNSYLLKKKNMISWKQVYSKFLVGLDGIKKFKSV